jgi:hypothetical protein
MRRRWCAPKPCRPPCGSNRADTIPAARHNIEIASSLRSSQQRNGWGVGHQTLPRRRPGPLVGRTSSGSMGPGFRRDSRLRVVSSRAGRPPGRCRLAMTTTHDVITSPDAGAGRWRYCQLFFYRRLEEFNRTQRLCEQARGDRSDAECSSRLCRQGHPHQRGLPGHGQYADGSLRHEELRSGNRQADGGARTHRTLG